MNYASKTIRKPAVAAVLGAGAAQSQRPAPPARPHLRALEELGSEANSGFIRAEANLAIIVVSDEPDYCTLGEPDSDDFVCTDEFVEWLDEFKGSEPGASSRTQLSLSGWSSLGIAPT